MNKTAIAFIIGILAAMAGFDAYGAGDIASHIPVLKSMARSEKIPLDSAIVNNPALLETVLVGGDTAGYTIIFSCPKGSGRSV